MKGSWLCKQTSRAMGIRALQALQVYSRATVGFHGNTGIRLALRCCQDARARSGGGVVGQHISQRFGPVRLFGTTGGSTSGTSGTGMTTLICITASDHPYKAIEPYN